jgi:nucleoside-triphosphatase THEP1
MKGPHRTARLAGVGLRSPHRVGRYGVDLDALDAVAVPALAPEERRPRKV